MSLRSDDLDSVGELYAEDDFRQLIVTIKVPPAFLGGLGKLEDHGERGLIGKTSLCAHGAVAHGGERAFDGVRSMAFVTGMRMAVPRVPAVIGLIAAYGATIRDRGTGSTKVRAGRCTR